MKRFFLFSKFFLSCYHVLSNILSHVITVTGDDLDTISIVNSLKQRMKYEGLSQTKVARSLGKGQATVSQILNVSANYLCCLLFPLLCFD